MNKRTIRILFRPRLFSLVILGALTASCSAPTGTSGSGSGSGSGLILSLTEAELVVNGPALQLTASAPVNWSSSDTDVATVSASGLVTPLAKGRTVITASDGSTAATCIVDSKVLMHWGSAQTAGGPVPVYWKDGVLHTLPVGTGTQIYGVAQNALVMGTDVYLTGYLTDSSQTVSTPVYWKNGALNVLTVPAGYTYTRSWVQPAVGPSGSLYFRINLNQDLDGETKPGFLIGGTWTPMSMKLPSGQTAERGEVAIEFLDRTTGIFYAAGWLQASGSRMVPVYWTGTPGTVTAVGDASSASGISAVAFLPGAPSVPGIPPVVFTMVSWDATGLPSPSWYLAGNKTAIPTAPYANGIVFSNLIDASGDRYSFGIAGTAATGPEFWNSAVQAPVYWKNGQIITLPLPAGYTNGVENGFHRDSTGAFYFTGQAVNAAGTSYIPVQWFNGVVSPLPIDGYFGGSANGYVVAVDF